MLTDRQRAAHRALEDAATEWHAAEAEADQDQAGLMTAWVLAVVTARFDDDERSERVDCDWTDGLGITGALGVLDYAHAMVQHNGLH